LSFFEPVRYNEDEGRFTKVTIAQNINWYCGSEHFVISKVLQQLFTQEFNILRDNDSLLNTEKNDFKKKEQVTKSIHLFTFKLNIYTDRNVLILDFLHFDKQKTK